MGRHGHARRRYARMKQLQEEQNETADVKSEGSTPAGGLQQPLYRRGRRGWRGGGADDKGILLPRLVMKLGVYGIALYFLKGKTKNENGELLSEKPGAEFSDRALWFTEKIKSLLGYDHKNESTQNEL